MRGPRSVGSRMKMRERSAIRRGSSFEARLKVQSPGPTLLVEYFEANSLAVMRFAPAERNFPGQVMDNMTLMLVLLIPSDNLISCLYSI